MHLYDSIAEDNVSLSSEDEEESLIENSGCQKIAQRRKSIETVWTRNKVVKTLAAIVISVSFLSGLCFLVYLKLFTVNYVYDGKQQS